MTTEEAPQDQPQEKQETQNQDNGDEEVKATKKKCRRRSKAFKASIQKQMEFYFSDSNLSKDRYLAELIKKSPEIEIKEFLKFNKIKALTTDPAKIASALKKSEMLKVSEDGTKVCRITPIVERKDVDDCTIYVQKLPPDVTHDMLVKFFSEFGKVVYVSIPKFKPKKQDKMKNPECMKRQKIKGFAFIEFETPEGVENCMKKFQENNATLPTEVTPEQIMSIITHEDYKPIEDITQSTEKTTEPETSEKKQEKNINISASTESTETKADESTEKPAETKVPEKRKRKSKSLSDVNDLTQVKKEENLETKTSERKRKLTEEIAEPSKKLKRSESCPKNKGSSTTSDSLVENEENQGKKSRKRHSVDGVQTLHTETHPKKKKKKNDHQNEEREVFSDENDVNEKEKTSKKKKQKNKRIRVGKDQPPIPPDEGKLEVMRKSDWKALRNKYLGIQRRNMRELKKRISNIEFCQNLVHNTDFPWGQDQFGFCCNIRNTKVSDKLKFKPGVIVKVELNESDDPLTLKDIYRSSDHPYIKYVDAPENAKEIFLRFDTADAAQTLVEASEQRTCTVLTGPEEKEYWDKIIKDRTEKFSKKDRPKLRGRQKVLKRADKVLVNHKRFDD